MNKTEFNGKNTDHDLNYLIPLFFILFLILFVLLCVLKSKLFRRCSAWCCGLENQTDLRERLLEDQSDQSVIWSRDRGVILVKRCDQSSTYEIENHIKSRLKSRVRFLEKPWDRGLDNGERPVIVFCVISSRIGTDIESAMRGVHGNSRVILVLLHCIISSFLRSDLSDDEELLDPTMKNRMTGIAHFAFSEREGVYDCKQNRDGHQKLFNLINFLN